MPRKRNTDISDVEKRVKEHFKPEKGRALPPEAKAPNTGSRVDSLVVPDKERRKMPFTKDAYLIREDPNLVTWERELRKFLRNLSPLHEHRITASMVYEWATNLSIPELQKEEARQKAEGVDLRGKSTWRSDMRKLNHLLRDYFGKPYMTHIMGRKVPRAYTVRKGYYIYRHRPKTLTLYAEWQGGAKL